MHSLVSPVLVRLAAKHGIKLRQSYQRLAKRSLQLANRYAHARQMRRARREIKRLKTFLAWRATLAASLPPVLDWFRILRI